VRFYEHEAKVLLGDAGIIVAAGLSQIPPLAVKAIGKVLNGGFWERGMP